MTYSAPERSTERALARRKVDRIYQLKGCPVCKRAIHGWGLSACRDGHKFPRCIDQDKFQLDHERLKGA